MKTFSVVGKRKTLKNETTEMKLNGRIRIKRVGKCTELKIFQDAGGLAWPDDPAFSFLSSNFWGLLVLGATYPNVWWKHTQSLSERQEHLCSTCLRSLSAIASCTTAGNAKAQLNHMVT